MSGNITAIINAGRVGYPVPPFHPDTRYPELLFSSTTSGTNPVYQGVRELYRLLKYDTAHHGTPAWNPLGWLIKPGETVFIKPNMIAHKHLENDDWEHVITHGSVLRAVIDYVYIALGGRGRIIVGDGPQTDSQFDRVVSLMGLKEIQAVYQDEKQFSIDIVDLRDEGWIVRDDVVVEKVKLAGDPLGKRAIDLGRQSMFAVNDRLEQRYYGAFYDIEETNRHHGKGKHEYEFSRSPLAADVFISLPKLKTHKKCGITVNLKGSVGLNANKNWLPHYKLGSPENGGDQFAVRSSKSRLENLFVVNAKKFLAGRNPLAQQLARFTKKGAYRFFGENKFTIRSGNWYGNDTVWRMVLDLNRILMYADSEGAIRASGGRKRFFSLVDGVVAMEGDGPVGGTRKEAGVLVAGPNPVAVDVACAALMGFDYRLIPMLAHSFDTHDFPLIDGGIDSISLVSNVPEWNKPPAQWTGSDGFHFRPHFAWSGHIEFDKA